MINKKSCYTHPLLVPNLPINHPLASIHTSFAYAYRLDAQFRKEVDLAAHHRVFLWEEKMLAKVMTQRMDLIQNTTTDDDLYLATDLPYVRYIQEATPIKALRASTERMLWHQRLGHPSDYYLYTAHKFINGVPKFKHNDPILEKCSTCIRAKQSKSSGTGNTMKATRPFQGFSVDMGYSGQTSKDNNRSHEYLGLHGETCWILVKDHFTGYLIGKCQKTKASPLNWIRDTLSHFAPGQGVGENRYVHMDQGGELYNNPKVRKIFEKRGFAIHPTGADALH